MELRQHESKLRKKLRQSRLLSITLLLSSLQQIADAEDIPCECEDCRAEEEESKEVTSPDTVTFDLTEHSDRNPSPETYDNLEDYSDFVPSCDPTSSPLFMRVNSGYNEKQQRKVRFASSDELCQDEELPVNDVSTDRNVWRRKS